MATVDRTERELNDYRELGTVNGRAYKVSIHIDSHDFQHHCTIDLWTPAGWTHVWRLLPSQVTTRKLYNKLNVETHRFANERNQLLEVAHRLTAAERSDDELDPTHPWNVDGDRDADLLLVAGYFGWEEVDTGGGCTAWRKDLTQAAEDGGEHYFGDYALITDSGGADTPKSFREPVVLGYYDVQGDQVGSTETIGLMAALTIGLEARQ